MADADSPDQTKETDDRVAENEEEIVLKMPTGQKVIMLSPYQDGGDAPWLVPKQERDLEYFEIPWNELIDEKARKQKLDHIVVLSQNPLYSANDFDLNQLRTEQIFKSRCDVYNSKHIIEAVIREKVVEKTVPARTSIGSGDGLADEVPLPLRRTILVHNKKPKKIFRPSKQRRLAELIYKLENIPENDTYGSIFELIDAEIEKEKQIIADRERRKELRRLQKLAMEDVNVEISIIGEFGEEDIPEGEHELAEIDLQHSYIEGVDNSKIPASSGTSMTAEVTQDTEIPADADEDSRISLKSIGFGELEYREKILREIECRENIEKTRRKEQRARAINNMKERLLARLRRENSGNIEKTIIKSMVETPPLQTPGTPDHPFDLCRLITLKQPYMLELIPKSWTIQQFCNYFYGSQQKNTKVWQSRYAGWRDEQIRETLRFYLHETASSRGWLSSPYYQFAMDSGLLLPSSGKIYKRKLLSFVNSPDYAEKKEKYGNILVGGVLSEDKMQELVTLGLVEQDPFLKDLLELSKGKREKQPTINNLLTLEVNGEWSNENEITKLVSENASEAESENVASSEAASTAPTTPRPVSTDTLTVERSTENVSEGETDVELGSKATEDKLEARETAKIDDGGEEMKKIFGEQLFHLVWVHPKNFQRLFNEAKLTLDDEGKTDDLQAFIDSWKTEWKVLTSSMVDDSLKQLGKATTDQKHQKTKTYTRAFLRRLKNYYASGCVPSFLLDGFTRDGDQQSSYLMFLERMKKAYAQHLTTDKEKMNQLITFLKEILADLQNEKKIVKEESARELAKTEKVVEDDVRMEDEAGDARKALKPSSKTKFSMKFNNAYTLQDLIDGNLSKGPIFIDNELKGLDEAHVKSIYSKNNVNTETTVDPSKRFAEWLCHRVDDKKKRLNQDLLRTNEIESYKVFQATECYQTLVNCLKSIQHHPEDFQFLFRRFEHYIGPEFAELHKKYNSFYSVSPREKENFDEGLNQNVVPYFQKPGVQTASDSPLPVTISDLVDKMPRGDANFHTHIPTVADQIYGHLIPMVQDQFVNVFLDPDQENHEERELSENEVEYEFDPFFCPKIGPTHFKFDPYGCLKKDQKINFEGQLWYKSGRERAMRAFREQHDSFFKYVDISRLKRDSSEFDVWKMAASGKLFQMYEKFKKPLEMDAKEKQEEFFEAEIINKRQEASEIITKGLDFLKEVPRDAEDIPTQDKEVIASQTSDKILRILFKKFMPLRTYNKQYEPILVNKAVKPEKNYIVFSTLTCSNRQKDKPLKPIDDNTLFNVLNACGTLIFDITRSKNDMYICCWYLRKLFLKREKLRQQKEKDEEAKFRDAGDRDLLNAKRSSENQPEFVELDRPEQHIILITNFMSWADSPDPVKVEINAKNFYSRKPHADYRDYYTFENLIHRIGNRKPFNIRTTIVYSGLTFGHEEDGLVYMFKMAYENQREIPIYGPGTNFPPMVHVDDLSKVVTSLIPAQNDSLVFVVQKIRRSLKKRVLSVAGHISYAHVRTSPSAFYDKNNLLPKNVHDNLQLNIKAKHVDLHPLMRTPKIPKPFSRGAEGYQLIRELKISRGIEVRTVLLIGAPSKIKWDLAKAISVLYGIPLITRRNIMTEWLKIRHCLQEVRILRKNSGEQNPDDENDKPASNPTLDEVKQVVLEENCDVNRHWLLIHLKMILRTIRYRKVGYVLCDVPLSEKDAEFLFNNRPHKPEPKRFHDVSVFTRTPAKVIFLEMNQFNNHHPYAPDADPVVSDDWDDFWKFHNAKSDASMFFKRRLHPVHQLSAYDDFLLQKVVGLIGRPPRPGGDEMFEKVMKIEMDNTLVQPTEKIENTTNLGNMQSTAVLGPDRAEGTDTQFPESLPHNCLPLYQNVHRYYLHVSTEDGTVGLGSGAAPFKTMRRKWCAKSDLFTRIPSASAEPMWDLSRKFWNPRKENEEYSRPFNKI